MQKAEKISDGQIRDYRLWAHHLDAKRPMSALKAAAGACGVQNSPPGAWESAMFNRLEGCTLRALNDALYVDKTLLQAWSFRGAPAVFPTEDSDAFLASLSARPGEEPWIYTRGIGLALDYLGMSFDETLSAVRAAARYLNAHTVKSKEALDETLARIVAQDLPPQKRALWSAPSMYGSCASATSRSGRSAFSASSAPRASAGMHRSSTSAAASARTTWRRTA